MRVCIGRSWELLEMFALGTRPRSRMALGGHQALPENQTGLEEAASWGRKGQGGRELC